MLPDHDRPTTSVNPGCLTRLAASSKSQRRAKAGDLGQPGRSEGPRTLVRSVCNRPSNAGESTPSAPRAWPDRPDRRPARRSPSKVCDARRMKVWMTAQNWSVGAGARRTTDPARSDHRTRRSQRSPDRTAGRLCGRSVATMSPCGHLLILVRIKAMNWTWRHCWRRRSKSPATCPGSSPASPAGGRAGGRRRAIRSRSVCALLRIPPRWRSEARSVAPYGRQPRRQHCDSSGQRAPSLISSCHQLSGQLVRRSLRSLTG